MISPQQREARRRMIGSSDIAAIVGVDPWRTAADVYWSKKGVETPENSAMRMGTRLEPVVLDWAEEQIGDPIVRDVSLISATNPLFGANLDGRGQMTGAVVEAKTHGLFGPARDGWGLPGTDEVPDKVLVQVQWQMLVSEAELAWVAALIGGRGTQLYKVVRNEALIGALADRAEEFWSRHVALDVPPDDAPSLETALRIPRIEGKRTVVADHLVEAWNAAKEASKAAGEEADRLKAQILQAMGDSSIGECEFGEVVVNQYERRGYTVEPTTVRDVRFKKAKETA